MTDIKVVDDAIQTIAEQLPILQAFAEGRMRWQCRVERGEGVWVTDPATGYEVPGPAPVIYRGPFRVRSHQPHESTPDVGGATVSITRLQAHLPAVERIPILVAAGTVEAVVGAMPFREGDLIIRVVAGQDAGAYRVTSSHDTTDQTAQRLPVEQGA